MQPAKPKLGVVKVGGDDHGGHGYLKATLDSYPVKFGLRQTDQPDSSKAPPVYRAKKAVK